MSDGYYRHVSSFIKWRDKRQFFLCYFMTSALLCDNQLCSDIALLMKRCVSILFMNNFFSDLNPRVNISLADEIFSPTVTFPKLHFCKIISSFFYFCLLFFKYFFPNIACKSLKCSFSNLTGPNLARFGLVETCI